MQMAMETVRKAHRSQHPEFEEILQESTQAVLDEVRSLSRLVSEFSEFARLPSPKLGEVSPLTLLDHALRLYGSAPEDVSVRLDSRYELESLPDVRADQDQIGRALINLVKNALEALQGSAGGGETVLSAKAEQRGGRQGVCLIVQDDGPGMSEEVRQHLFDPYFTTKPEGTGLGLAIVDRIVAEHDGAINVHSAEGEGTRFELWLPSASHEPQRA
jgi:signal transduction histidine kinase